MSGTFISGDLMTGLLGVNQATQNHRKWELKGSFIQLLIQLVFSGYVINFVVGS